MVSLSMLQEYVQPVRPSCSGMDKNAVTPQIAGKDMFGVQKNNVVSPKKLITVLQTPNGMVLIAHATLDIIKLMANV